jgi:hypothetical protein
VFASVMLATQNHHGILLWLLMLFDKSHRAQSVQAGLRKLGVI